MLLVAAFVRRHRGAVGGWAPAVLRSVSSSSGALSEAAATTASAHQPHQPSPPLPLPPHHHQQDWSDQQVRELLAKVCDLGQGAAFPSSRTVKEVAQLMKGVPDESVMRIITAPFAAPSSSSSRRGEVADPLVTIIEALIYIRSSSKLRPIVDHLRDDALLAHRVGTRRLLHACATVVGAAMAAEAKATSSTVDWQGQVDRIAHEVVRNIVPLLVRMPPHARCHHVTSLLSLNSLKGMGMDRMLLTKNIMAEVKAELVAAESRGERVDYTAVGDVALSGFNGLRLVSQHLIALELVRSCHADGLLDATVISPEGFTLAVTTCLPAARTRAGGDGDSDSSAGGNEAHRYDRQMWVEGLQCLLDLVPGNSFKAIHLREHFVKIVASRGPPECVPAWVEKIEAEGHLVGTRAYNHLIAAYMRTRDLEKALMVLDRSSAELYNVRKMVRTVGSMEVFGQLLSSSPRADVTAPGDDAVGDMSNSPSSFSGRVGGSVAFRSIGGKHVTMITAAESAYHPPPGPTPRPSFGLNKFSYAGIFMSPMVKDAAWGLRGPVSESEMSRIVSKLLDRMRRGGVVPDGMILSRAAALAGISGDLNLTTKVLEIAHQNSLSSSKHGLFQPHTHSHTHLLREGRKGDPPADGAGGGNARWKVYPELPEAVQLELAELSNVGPPGEVLTVGDLARLYRHAIVCARKAKRHGKTKEYLLAMAERGLQLDLKASATAMRAFIESKRYDDVLWVFESLPSWGAARDEGHAASLIQALAEMGRWNDAWRAITQMRKKHADGTTSQPPAVYNNAMRALLKRLLISMSWRGEIRYPDRSSKKMSRALKIQACAELMLALAQTDKASNTAAAADPPRGPPRTPQDARMHNDPLKRVAGLLASFQRTHATPDPNDHKERAESGRSFVLEVMAAAKAVAAAGTVAQRAVADELEQELLRMLDNDQAAGSGGAVGPEDDPSKDEDDDDDDEEDDDDNGDDEVARTKHTVRR